MNWYISIPVFILILVFFIKENYLALISLIILSLNSSMLFFDFFGSRILIYQLISLLSIFFITKRKKPNILSNLKIEYLLLIILGVIYGLVFPWDHDVSYNWNQSPLGRSLVALFRIFSELALVYFIYFVFRSQKVKKINFLNALSIIIIFGSSIAIFDLFSNYKIYKFLFGSNFLYDAIINRMIGLNHEPRALARSLVYSWFILLYFKSYSPKIKFINYSLLLGLITILFTFSFSSYILLLIGLIIFFKNNIFKNPLTLFFLVSFIVGLSFIISKNEYTKIGIAYRISMVLDGRLDYAIPNEPDFFTKFEVFDRAALNFFYNEPKHLLLGTGPNLISIPSSKYLDKSAVITFDSKLVGVPGVGVINLLSRSGIIGLFLYLIMNIKIIRLMKKRKQFNLVVQFSTILVFFIFVFHPWYFFGLAFFVAESESEFEKLKIKN